MEALDNSQWQLNQYQLNNVTVSAVGKYKTTIKFASGHVTAFAGCNHISGEYSIEQQKIKVQHLSSTMIGCAADLHAHDNTLYQLLSQLERYQMTDDKLILFSKHGQLSLTRAATSSTATFSDTLWKLSTINKDHISSSILMHTQINLKFSDSEGSGFSGCNNYYFTFTRTGNNTMTIESPMMTTKKVCEQDIMEQERVYLHQLGQVKQYKLSDNQLSLEIDDSLSLLFVK